MESFNRWSSKWEKKKKHITKPWWTHRSVLFHLIEMLSSYLALGGWTVVKSHFNFSSFDRKINRNTHMNARKVWNNTWYRIWAPPTYNLWSLTRCSKVAFCAIVLPFQAQNCRIRIVVWFGNFFFFFWCKSCTHADQCIPSTAENFSENS